MRKKSRMKLNVGDVLFESMSQNIGAITKIFDHPDGKIMIDEKLYSCVDM